MPWCVKATAVVRVLLPLHHTFVCHCGLEADRECYSRTLPVSGRWHAVRHVSCMTITEMTNTQTLYARAAAKIAQRNAGGVKPSGHAGSQSGDGQGGGGGTSDTALARITALNEGAAAAKIQQATGDTVELSAGATGAVSDKKGGSQPFAGLVEQFVRTRSAMSFTIPGQGGFGSMSFAFEIETAYRVIRPLQPDEVIDFRA